MKKTLLFGMVALATLGITSCGNSSNPSSVTQKGNGDKEVLYSGILPVADAQGTVYTLKLDFDDDNNYTDGDFTMVENTLASDSLTSSGIKIMATSYSKGDFRKESKEVNGATVQYIRLLPDAKDGLGAASAATTYFLVNADESLTMVGADLQKSETPGMNYTLTVVK